MLDFTGKSILVTGGTGSFGKKFIKRVLEENPGINRVVVFSRDELKQYEMSLEFSREKYPNLRYFIGDVRDKDRLYRAMQGIDYVVHAAALKQVPTAEYNPFECIKTNVLGAQNIIEVALDLGVKKVVALSTDKAAAPINLYGATKLCSDKLFVAANNMAGDRDINFSVVRYGNVMGSRGSVIPFFMNQREKGELPITDKSMSRFNISLDEGVDLVLFALEKSIGGEVYVPKIPSYNIMDVAKAIAPSCTYKEVGIRPGEKIDEEMITKTDSIYTIELDKYFIITPPHPFYPLEESKKKYLDYYQAKNVDEGFFYNSGNNTEWIGVEELRDLIIEHVDPAFKPL